MKLGPRGDLTCVCPLQVSGDDTTVIQAVLACDTERSQLLKEEQTLLRHLNKEAPDGAQPSQPATANGHPATPTATANGNGNAKADLPNGTTAAETRDSSGAVGDKENASTAADAAESKAAAQLAQVSCIISDVFGTESPFLEVDLLPKKVMTFTMEHQQKIDHCVH